METHRQSEEYFFFLAEGRPKAVKVWFVFVARKPQDTDDSL